MVEEPGGVSTIHALCLVCISLSVWLVLIVAALSMMLTGHQPRRKYKPRKPMSDDPDAPMCECGKYKRQKHHGGYIIKCYRCRFSKGGSSATTQAASGSSSDAETDAGPSQQQARPSNTLRRSREGVLSPTPTIRGPRPQGCTWNGSSYVPTDPRVTLERQQAARGGRGFSTLQPSWLADFSWCGLIAA